MTNQPHKHEDYWGTLWVTWIVIFALAAAVLPQACAQSWGYKSGDEQQQDQRIAALETQVAK